MSAGRLDLHIEQGAAFERTFTITDDGVPLDLTGYTARFQIRDGIGDDAAVLTSVPSGDPNVFMSITAGTGQILVYLDGLVTQSFTPAEPARMGPQALGVWGLEITSSNSITTRLLEGVVTISARVLLG